MSNETAQSVSKSSAIGNVRPTCRVPDKIVPACNDLSESPDVLTLAFFVMKQDLEQVFIEQNEFGRERCADCFAELEASAESFLKVVRQKRLDHAANDAGLVK